METMLKSLSDGQLAGAVKDSARQIWLAGLGAYSLAETERNKVFTNLVEEGEVLERRIRKAAETKADQVKERVSDARNRLEQVFEERVAQALQSLSIPTDEDIKDLSRKIDELAASIKALSKLREQPARDAERTAA